MIDSAFEDDDEDVDQLDTSPVKASPPKKRRTTTKSTKKGTRSKDKPEPESELTDIEGVSRPGASKPPAPKKTPPAPSITTSSAKNKAPPASSVSTTNPSTSRQARLAQRNRDKEESTSSALPLPSRVPAKRSRDLHLPVPAPPAKRARPPQTVKPSDIVPDESLSAYQRIVSVHAGVAFLQFLRNHDMSVYITDTESTRKALVSQFYAEDYPFVPNETPPNRNGSPLHRIKAAQINFTDFAKWLKNDGLSIDVGDEELHCLVDSYLFWLHMETATQDLLSAKLPTSS
jgi:hypothetical protein